MMCDDDVYFKKCDIRLALSNYDILCKSEQLVMCIACLLFFRRKHGFSLRNNQQYPYSHDESNQIFFRLFGSVWQSKYA
jgi:hypothetical protein